MKFLHRFGIVGKIMSGYLTILLVSLVVISFCLISLNKNRTLDKQVSDVYYPTLLFLKDVGSFVDESNNLTNNWVYQPNNKDKERLRFLHTKEYARLAEEMSNIVSKIQKDYEKETMDEISKKLQQFLVSEKLVMDKLNNEEAYGNDVAVDEAITTLDKNVKTDYEAIQKSLTTAVELQNTQLQSAIEKKSNSYDNINSALILSIIIFSGIIAAASLNSIRTIQKPVKRLSDKISELATGKFVVIESEKREDEIGQMTQAIIGMVNGLKQKADFATNIGNNIYDSDFQLLSSDDTMGQALMAMRDNLKKASEDDKKRNWATEGLAKFVDILRSNNQSKEKLAENILTNLVKYLKANQGALFVVNDDDEKDIHLEMEACFAYDRKKHLQKRIEIGEGLVGQAYLEKETIYLTEVPQNYVAITSGLGESTPSCILIVPLKINDKIYGIIEIASFFEFERYMVEFAEKLGESIASTISASKINDRTTKLLAQTQIQAEEMRSQEEEMRQNMEELQATQEEMSRKENDYIAQIENLKTELNKIKS